MSSRSRGEALAPVDPLPEDRPTPALVAGAPVTCLATGDTVLVRPGQPVLEAALGQGVELEHGCRVGVCGACAVVIVQGAENVDEPDPIESDSLERFQMPRRCRLACRLTCRGPLTLRPLDD